RRHARGVFALLSLQAPALDESWRGQGTQLGTSGAKVSEVAIDVELLVLREAGDTAVLSQRAHRVIRRHDLNERPVGKLRRHLVLEMTSAKATQVAVEL